MKIHTMQIPDEGMHIEGEDPSEVLGLTGDPALALSPIRYVLDVGISEGGIFAVGQLAVDTESVCVRCLEKFQRVVEVPDFAMQMDLDGKEMVDLTDQVREDILLALPAHPHCDWNGEKVCNAVFPKAADVAPAAEDRRDVWKSLDNLKL